ncbi:hypothetical protein [Candidatus Phytoplasma solani]|uniref:Uncharacterized protein n=1 Tax=Candidatus Phytoplasma solani TaxID=69896 RepID=A0A421NX91_9MOLU|nr:hypothetical protein [Candidatus Phytoplasma solani]RMI88649.1 hypothetical protein PSSA1_v1c3780 [Candidatus Phytoplasma solani]CCP87984.1 hypothetical protein S284_00470 [Candidatus Phytoplasma solani]
MLIKNILKNKKYLKIIKKIDQTMTSFEGHHKLLKTFHMTKFSENYINAHLCSELEGIGKSTLTEAIKGHGKVDVLVNLGKNLQYVIEAKNYSNIDNLEFVYKQVLHRIHHRFLCASIILLVNGSQKDKFKTIIEQINQWVKEKKAEKQNIIINKLNIKFYDNFFVIKIKNPNTGYDMLINLACYHLEFNVNHAIENKNIRISEEEEFNKKRRNFLTLLDKINTFDLEKTKEEHVDVLKKEFIDIMEFCQQYNREFLIPLKEKK